jgi:hypothetical protein
MKKHLINILYDLPDNGGQYHFVGLVAGIYVCEKKLFKNAFYFEMPDNTQITIY